MSIYLGNLSVEQIERRYEFRFTDEERTRLKELWHQKANFSDGEYGWHMFDFPEFLVVSNGDRGREALGIFQRHSNEMKGLIRGGFEQAIEGTEVRG